MKPAELMIMACTDKTGQRVWAVQSTSQTKANGFPTFHLVTWNASTASWSCPCQSRKPCIHMRFASEASQREQQRVDAAFDALTAIHFGLDNAEELATQYFEDYDDTNPRHEELEVTIRGYEHLLVGGIDGVVNGRDERMIEAIKKEKARIAAKEIAEPLAAQPSQVRRLYRTTTGRTQEAW